ncbi:MAG: PIN/TRAM domain-containing protein [Planctomycetota bacterium]|nr:MAG: PIN/TRAM domain-containing protein [Planctomycetota bacterium]
MLLLYFVRFLFLVTSTAFLLLGLNLTANKSEQDISVFVIALALTVLAVAVEWLTPKKSLFTLTGIFFGLLIGMFVSWALNQVIIMMNDFYWQLPEDTLRMGLWIADLCICYLCVSIVIRTKDDFRFLVPYVEFTRQTRGLRPLVLDTSVIIDGRIADIAETKLFDAPLIVPRFVLNELQLVADSADKGKRNRGRRGLDMLNKLQHSPVVEVTIDDTPPPGVEEHTEVDQKLVAFSKNCDGRLVTNDFNLNKVASLRGVDVVNINDLANALKTITLPGETMTVKVIRRGEDPEQGVGFIEDGTMVVIDGASNKIGRTVLFSVTSALQTSAGRMVFGKYEQDSRPPASSSGGSNSNGNRPGSSDSYRRKRS